MNTHDIKNKVFEEIHAGKVRMRPRMYFVVRILSLIGLALLAFLAAVFFISFVLFALHESGESALLAFGPRGLGTFVVLFPWLIIACVLTLVVALEWLLRTFRFGYHIPILRVFGGVVALTLTASFLIAVTPLHRLLLDQADRDALPVLGGMYENVHASHKAFGVFRGTVTSLQPSSFTISHNDLDRDADDGIWSVIAPAGFDVTGTLHAGDKVYVAGNATSGVIHAYGVQKLSSDE